jgi:Cys-tRNA(Pro)/Cys-tRNA(Cys) deacylase
MIKTNACRILDAAKVRYELVEYPWSEEELDAVSVARKIGLPPEQVFKTLVLTGDAHRYFVAVIPGDAELALKRAARLTGNKSCALLPAKELLPLTGYVRGGCSPIGMKKHFPTFIDSSYQKFDRISVSPGKRGLQMLIAPADLLRVAEAQSVPFCDDDETQNHQAESRQ